MRVRGDYRILRLYEDHTCNMVNNRESNKQEHDTLNENCFQIDKQIPMQGLFKFFPKRQPVPWAVNLESFCIGVGSRAPTISPNKPMAHITLPFQPSVPTSMPAV